MSSTGSAARRPRLRIARPKLRVRRAWPRLRGRSDGTAPATIVPVDPRAALGPALDPDLLSIRQLLRPHGRRLWFRRIVRRAWIVVAAAVVAELGLWTLARLIPVELAPTIAVTILLVAGFALLALAVGSRPSIG